MVHIPSINGDLGDGLVLFYPHVYIYIYIYRHKSSLNHWVSHHNPRGFCRRGAASTFRAKPRDLQSHAGGSDDSPSLSL